jgi:serine/threonine protein kinase
MTPERYQLVNRIFHEALERTREDRAGFLREACGDDQSLRTEVDRMLAAQEQAGSFLDAPAFVALGHSATGERSGQRFIGSVIGHYRILSKLGEGGMGEVLLAQDTVLERNVALKLLPDEFITDRDRVRRFEQEARAASALNHPNIVTIHEISHARTEGGDLHFIAQEFIEGQTLRRRIEDGGLSLLEALDVSVQVASALQVAHSAGIAHRDIKPENIMLRPDGFIKILDFGLAKLLAPRSEASGSIPENSTFAQEKTAPGTILGTAVYMSPEQARGIEVDARSDIWSLGVVFYETLTGRLPFQGATMSDIIVSILEREPPPLSRFLPRAPLEAERIIRKALAKKRDERYQAVSEMALDLKSLKQRLEFDAELARFSEVDMLTKPMAANLQTEEHVARRTLAPDQKPGTRASSTLPRALRIGAILLVASVACFFAWSYFRPKTSTPPASTPERRISYWLTVQRMRNDREYEAPFESSGREIFESGWKFRLNLNSPQSGYVYLLNEGPTSGGAISYSLLFPSPSIHNGSAQIAADQPIQTGWYFLSEHAGTERLWIVWAAQPAPELEAVKGVFNSIDKGVIRDQKLLYNVRELLNKDSQAKPEIITDKINERTEVKFRAESLVQALELEHR